MAIQEGPFRYIMALPSGARGPSRPFLQYMLNGPVYASPSFAEYVNLGWCKVSYWERDPTPVIHEPVVALTYSAPAATLADIGTLGGVPARLVSVPITSVYNSTMFAFATVNGGLEDGVYPLTRVIDYPAGSLPVAKVYLPAHMTGAVTVTLWHSPAISSPGADVIRDEFLPCGTAEAQAAAFNAQTPTPTYTELRPHPAITLDGVVRNAKGQPRILLPERAFTTDAGVYSSMTAYQAVQGIVVTGGLYVWPFSFRDGGYFDVLGTRSYSRYDGLPGNKGPARKAVATRVAVLPNGITTSGGYLALPAGHTFRGIETSVNGLVHELRLKVRSPEGADYVTETVYTVTCPASFSHALNLGEVSSTLVGVPGAPGAPFTESVTPDVPGNTTTFHYSDVAYPFNWSW